MGWDTESLPGDHPLEDSTRCFLFTGCRALRCSGLELGPLVGDTCSSSSSSENSFPRRSPVSSFLLFFAPSVLVSSSLLPVSFPPAPRGSSGMLLLTDGWQCLAISCQQLPLGTHIISFLGPGMSRTMLHCIWRGSCATGVCLLPVRYPFRQGL